MFDSVTKPG
jgi:hypothetical protein